MTGHKISGDEREKVVELYEQGVERQQIQVETGITQPTIRKILEEAGYPTKEIKPPLPLSEEIKEKIVMLRKSGMPSQAIADKMGCSKGAVLRIISERIKGIQTHSKAPIAPYVFIKTWQEADTVQEVALSLGKTLATTYQLACNYRLKGVPLKKFKRRPYDWGELAEFAAMFHEGADEDES